MRRSLLVVVSSCLLTAAACGSDADSAGDAPSGASTSVPADETTMPQGDPSAEPETDIEEFCSSAQAFEDADPTSGVLASDDPALIEQGWDEFDSLMQGLVDTAPAEIAPDFEQVAATFRLIRTAYERAGWDALAVFDVVEADPELRAVFEESDPEVEAAGQRISAYIDEVCPGSG